METVGDTVEVGDKKKGLLLRSGKDSAFNPFPGEKTLDGFLNKNNCDERVFQKVDSLRSLALNKFIISSIFMNKFRDPTEGVLISTNPLNFLNIKFIHR